MRWNQGADGGASLRLRGNPTWRSGAHRAVLRPGVYHRVTSALPSSYEFFTPMVNRHFFAAHLGFRNTKAPLSLHNLNQFLPLASRATRIAASNKTREAGYPASFMGATLPRMERAPAAGQRDAALRHRQPHNIFLLWEIERYPSGKG